MSGPLPPGSADRLGRLAEQASMAGFSIAVAAPGRTATFSHGEDWPGSGRPVDPGTWFQAASTGKHVTACVILDLASKGQVDLDARIGSYLTDLTPDWADRTVSSLLHHTSGLPEYLTYAEGEVAPRTRADFMKAAASLPPIGPEGECWSYSNSNYILLGFLAAAVGGRPAGVMMEEFLAEAGAAAGARVASPDWARRANAHSYSPDAADEESLEREVIGDGDIAFTAIGALAWLEHLLDGTARGPGARLFAPTKAHGRAVPYGCGWFLDSLGDAPIAYHAGHYDGWTAMAYLNRGSDCGVIALSNLAPGTTRTIRSLALQALEDFLPGSTPLCEAPIADSRPDLTAIARDQMIRPESEANREFFAPELQLAIDRAGPARGIVNLWAGEQPDRFELVQERLVQDRLEQQTRMRRYRLNYGSRVEHVSIGTTADDRIYWAWPL